MSEGAAALESTLADLADAGPSRAKAAILVERARQLTIAGDVREGIEVGRAGLRLAEWCGDEQLQARVLITIGTALTMADAGGVAELERGIEIAERIGDLLEYLRGYNNLAEDFVAYGRLAEADAIFRTIADRLERAGYIQGLVWLYSSYAEHAFEMGEWERAQGFVDSFLRLLDQLSSHYLEFEVRYVQARLAYARGAVEESEELWALSLALAANLGDPQAAGPVRSGRAFALLELGRREEAEALTEEALALRDEAGRALYFRFLINLGWVLHDLGRPGDYPLPGRGKLWYDAGAALARGAFLDAAEILAQAGMRTDEAYARLRAAEALSLEGRRVEAQAQLETALAFYRSVGATTYVRRGEALLPASA